MQLYGSASFTIANFLTGSRSQLHRVGRLDGTDRLHDSGKCVLSDSLAIIPLTIIPPAILQMRIYALYHRNKVVVIVMLVTFLACSTASATIMGISLKGVKGNIDRKSVV